MAIERLSVGTHLQNDSVMHLSHPPFAPSKAPFMLWRTTRSLEYATGILAPLSPSCGSFCNLNIGLGRLIVSNSTNFGEKAAIISMLYSTCEKDEAALRGLCHSMVRPRMRAVGGLGDFDVNVGSDGVDECDLRLVTTTSLQTQP